MNKRISSDQYTIPFRISTPCILIPLLTGFFLRFRKLGYSSLWADEAYSVILARESIPAIVRELLNDSSPPMFYLLLKLWTSVFGETESSVRSLSALFSSILLVVAGFITLRLTKNLRITSITMLFLALSPTQVYFSQETRAYAMASCLILTALMGIIVELDSRGRGWYLIPAIILTIYTHNYGWLLWICFAAWSFLHIKNALLYNGIIALFASLWVPGLFLQITGKTTSWVPPLQLSSLQNTILSFAGKSQFLSTPFPFNTIVTLSALCLITLILAALISNIVKSSRHSLFLMFGMLPLLLAYGISLAKPVLLPGRHDTLFMAPLIVLTAASVHAISQNITSYRRMFSLCVSMAVIIMTTTQIIMYIRYTAYFGKANDRMVAEIIAEWTLPGKTAVITTDVTLPSFEYYLSGENVVLYSFPLDSRGSLPMDFLRNDPGFVEEEINRLIKTINEQQHLEQVVLARAGTLDAHKTLLQRLQLEWTIEKSQQIQSPRPFNSVNSLFLYSLPLSTSTVTVDQTNEHQPL